MPRPVQIYSFADFSKRTPTEQQPGDRLDAQFRAHADAIAELGRAVEGLKAAAAVLAQAGPRETLGSSLYYGAGGPYGADTLGATATASDWAQVSIDWAEHMPDTVPPNTVAIAGISGDHWSSRWWANQAAQIVAGFGSIGSIPGTQGVFAEGLTVTGPNGLSNLSHPAAGPVLLVVNGVAFLPVGAQPPFVVVGRTVTWLSTVYSLIPGQTIVAAWYPYAP